MSVHDAFDDYRKVVDADIEAVKEARRRRDLFKDAFAGETDVVEVMASGSLRRGTHKDPIHDVDLVIIFNIDEHPEWGTPGSSAADALDFTRGRVNYLLGATNGTFEKAVRLAKPRNHAVKCFLDNPDDPDAFTVDAMPALRRDGKLLIPEALSQAWVPSDPEYLIAAVAEKHAEWDKFASMIRALKTWAAGCDIKIKSLVMEVLALKFMPTDADRPHALSQFFTSAAYYIEEGYKVEDPAGICGAIQSDLDYAAFEGLLQVAAELAGKAVAAQDRNNHDQAIAVWRELFGDKFPAPDGGTGESSTTATTAIVTAPAFIPRPVKDTPQG